MRQLIIENWWPAFFGARMRARVVLFFRDASGATAIEFAMILVPFLGLLAGIFETGMTYYRLAQLQVVVENASRSIRLQSISGTLTYQQFIQQKICTWKSTGTVERGTLGRSFDCSKLYVSVQAPAAFAPGTSAQPTEITLLDQSSAITLPNADDLVIVAVYYPVSPIINILAGGAGGYARITAGQRSFQGMDSVFVLLATTAFRVEPD